MIRIQKILFLAVIFQTFCRVTSAEIPLVISKLPVPQLVDTNLLIKLDPTIINPHLKNWSLAVHLFPLDVVVIEVHKNNRIYYQPRIGSVSVRIETALRKPGGPWYRPWSEFNCSKNPDPFFSNYDGSKVALKTSQKLLEEIISKRMSNYERVIQNTFRERKELALLVALSEFQIWSDQILEEWRHASETHVREIEWQSYYRQAQEEGTCADYKYYPPASVESRMEELPVIQDGDFITPQIRIPAKRLGSLFSIRADIVLDTKTLNGVFLVNSGLARSLLSKNWLQDHGIDWRLHVSRFKDKLIRVHSFKVSGQALPLSEFAVGPLDNYVESDWNTCCDGIFGSDFLRLSTIEFYSKSPNELMIWDTQRYPFLISAQESNRGDRVSNKKWIEASVHPRSQRIYSQCIYPKTHKAVSVVWNTGLDVDFSDHVKEGKYEIQCSGKSVFEVNAQKNVLEVGMPWILKNRVVFDLPHGRIWLPIKP